MPAVVIRHGETALINHVSAHLHIRLTPNGRTGMQALAKRISGMPFTAIYASDITSAAQSGQVLADALGRPLHLSAGLRSWNLGIHAAASNDTAAPVIRSLIDTPDHDVPAGDSFRTYLRTFLGAALPLIAGRAFVAIVTHSRNIRTLDAWLRHGRVTADDYERAAQFGPCGAGMATPWGLQPMALPDGISPFPSEG